MIEEKTKKTEVEKVTPILKAAKENVKKKIKKYNVKQFCDIGKGFSRVGTKESFIAYLNKNDKDSVKKPFTEEEWNLKLKNFSSAPVKK